MRAVLLMGSAVVALLAASSGLADVQRDQARPTVRVAQLSPLVVEGQRFRPRQRIAITVTAQSTSHVQTMRTTRRGTFVARFAAIALDRCGAGLAVVVTTAAGPVAKTRMPERLCPPAIP